MSYGVFMKHTTKILHSTTNTQRERRRKYYKPDYIALVPSYAQYESNKEEK